MGIHGLQTFLENSGVAVVYDLTHAQWRAPHYLGSREICVDGCGLLRLLLRTGPDWLRGGDFDRIRDNVGKFVAKFGTAGFRLTVMFDGAIEPVKRATWFVRRRREATVVSRIFDGIHSEESGGAAGAKKKSDWLPAVNSMSALRKAFAFAGAKVMLSLGEADREIAHYCKVNNDSDYHVLDVNRYFTLDSLNPRESAKLSLKCYEQDKVLAYLNLRVDQLPVLAAMIGNDYIPTTSLFRLHWKLVKRHDPTLLTDADFEEKTPPQELIIPSILTFLRATVGDIFVALMTMTGEKLVEKIRTAAKAYNFAEIPHSIKPPASLPAALEPHWPKIVELHRFDRLYHEALAVLSYRCLNPGVVLEDPTRRSTWLIIRKLTKRLYGILLPGCNVASVSAPVSPVVTPSTPTRSGPVSKSGLTKSSPALPAAVAPQSPAVSEEIRHNNALSPTPPSPSVTPAPAVVSPVASPSFALNGSSGDNYDEEEPKDEDEGFGPGENDDEEDDLDECPDEDDYAIIEAARAKTYVELRHSSIVKEFVWYGGKDIRNPDVQEASYDIGGVPLDSFPVMLSADRNRRMANFLLAMDCREMNMRPLQSGSVPEVLVLVACALRYIALNTDDSEVCLADIDALIATAVTQATRSPNYKGKPSARGLPLHSIVIHLSTIYLRTLAVAQFLNDVRQVHHAFFSLRNGLHATNHNRRYYNGAVFHRKYYESHEGNVALMGDRPHVNRLFQAIRTAVTGGTRLQGSFHTPAKSPSAAPHADTRSPQHNQKSPAGGGARKLIIRSAPGTPMPAHTSIVATAGSGPQVTSSLSVATLLNSVQSSPYTPASVPPRAALTLAEVEAQLLAAHTTSPVASPTSAPYSNYPGSPPSPSQPWRQAPDAPAITPSFHARSAQRNPKASNAGKVKAACKFFAEGKCTYGDRCKYSHDLVPSAVEKK